MKTISGCLLQKDKNDLALPLLTEVIQLLNLLKQNTPLF